MRPIALVSIVSAMIGVMAAPRGVRAQDFFKLSPKPLAAGHAEWDKTDECTKCHELGGGVTNALCLDCHEHRPLGQMIAKKKGLHATFGDRLCRDCHTDHKGRGANITDWGKVGGRASFDHERTGFSLAGVHDKVACTSCHYEKLLSGRISYMGLPSKCNECHKNERTHRFTNKDLLANCAKCHDEKGGAARKMKPSEVPFDHEKVTNTALVGQHGRLDCNKCHVNAVMSMSTKRACAACHKNPHGKSFSKSTCDKCHGEERDWKNPTFDHDTTKFPLRGDHDTVLCVKCHKTLEKNPKKDCFSCHKDPHRDRFAGKTCEGCHGLGGDEKLTVDHTKLAGWPLTGTHKGLACRSCHRGNAPQKFEYFEAGEDCMGCHRHTNAHNGEFKDKKCFNCHKESGSTELVFDHQKDARFALTGLHLELEKRGECAKCHPNNKFRTNKLLCADCHKDVHQKELGATCEKCHATSVKFNELEFDHNRLSKFALEGAHTKADCEKCHPKREPTRWYKITKEKCIECHKDDDKHEGALGAECETCHTPEKGAPKFQHDVMTSFALTGTHKKTECRFCHNAKKDRPAAPPKLGWTKLEPGLARDMRFPAMGKECAECHFDVHEGRFGAQCGSCHDTTSFKNANGAVHDTGAFRLQGTHDRLACVRCHETNRLLTGLGEHCVGCHREDDIHNNSLGPYCGQCHQQIDWAPQRFNHAEVGFMLAGAHRTAQCRDCHGVGVYQGTPRACTTCHLDAAMKVADPVHSPAIGECENCHSQIAFAPAKFYHPWYDLVGPHRAARCGNCHQAGVYAGTARECYGCHERDYLATSVPSHRLHAFDTDCTKCHTQLAWTSVVRYTHQSFQLVGAHRPLACATCHTGSGEATYRGAFGGLPWDDTCRGCHGPGSPEDRYTAAPDHLRLNYPLNCAASRCHAVARPTWQGALAPP